MRHLFRKDKNDSKEVDLGSISEMVQKLGFLSLRETEDEKLNDIILALEQRHGDLATFEVREVPPTDNTEATSVTSRESP